MGFLFIIIAIILETTLTTLPLTLLVLLFLAVVTRKNEVFLLAFLSGLILDILMIRSIGLSSIYFVIFVCIIFLYQKKFEIETLPFIVGFSFLGSVGYLVITGSASFLQEAILVTLFTTLSFLVFKILNKNSPKVV